MKSIQRYTLLLQPLLLLASCTAETPMVSLGIDDTYYVERMRKLPLSPAFTGEKYAWTLMRPDGRDSLLSTDRDYIFLASTEGSYDIRFDVIDSVTPYSFDFRVNVLHEEVEYSPYIAKVHEYCPAPGQFVNEMPKYDPGNSYADILKKTEECISGTNDVMITLGGYGGYVTFSFDHTVINEPGKRDFRIWGNCFYELTDPDAKGGSAEPGIVMVSYDANCNGLPDDSWYELAGSEYRKPQTLHNYTLRYRRPDDSREPVPDESGFLSDMEYIPWSDSEGIEGFLPKNTFHMQSYWPQWTDAETLSFTGTLLAPNAKDLSGDGSYYVLYSYDWGYADNHPNEFADLNSFDIGWAVDGEGRPVHLPGVDFVRVYTGLNQYCGWLGETSTEISRAQDLHIPADPYYPSDPITNNKP